ncbi:ABC transporter ATP-binding protein [archaeon]|nr:ABC transporter ATP-binding protein [archaeon]
MIKLNKVWKTYHMGVEEVNALRNVDLSIYENQFIVIVGHSGSGKSTLMNLIGCLDLPSKGEIYLDNEDISEIGENNLARIRGKKIGFVFQKFNLIPTLTALQNVTLPSVFQGAPLNDKAKELLTFVGLQHRLNHRPNQLSGGEQQRVAIARSLINDPDIILADEPTGNLDTKTGDTVMNLFKELHTRGKTIIFVTHNPNLEQYAQRIIKINDGMIKEVKK